MNSQRILLIRLQHHGDVLLSTPVVNTLQDMYPQAQIDMLVYKGTELILAANPVIHRVHTTDRQLKHQGLKKQFLGEKTLFGALKAADYDLIINLSGQWRGAFYSLLLKPKISIAFEEPRRKNLAWRFAHTHLTIPVGGHTVLRNLSILAPLKMEQQNTEVTMAYTAEDAEKARAHCLKKGFSEYLLIQPTARWAFKTWSPDRTTQLINHLTAQGHAMVLAGGPDKAEQALIQNILAGCTHPDRLLNLAGQTSFGELAALIDQARLFIGVDSAPMHMAAALKKPSVVLFGPSDLAQWSPWNAPHTLIWAGNYRELPAPLEIDVDTLDRYLDAIPVQDVIKAIEGWLNQPEGKG